MWFRLGDGLATVNQCYKQLHMMAYADFWVSLACLLAGLLLMGQMYRMERRPPNLNAPRLVPTTLLLLLGLLVALGAGAHLLGYFGIHPPQRKF